MNWDEMTWDEKIEWVFSACPDPVSTRTPIEEQNFQRESTEIRNKNLMTLLIELNTVEDDDGA